MCFLLFKYLKFNILIEYIKDARSKTGQKNNGRIQLSGRARY